MQWLMANLPMILAVLLGISESLALIPSIKANSVFQLILSGIQKLVAVMGQPKQ
jgi:hypothetical protein